MLPKKGLCMPFSVWLIFLASWRSSAGHVVGTQRTTIDPAVNVVVIQAFQNKFEWKRPRNWKIPVHFLVYDLFSRVSNLTLLEELCLEQYKASVCVCVCVCVCVFKEIWSIQQSLSQDHFVLCVWVLRCVQLFATPSDSSILGIFQARILERVAISFSGGFSNPGIEPKSLPSLAWHVDSLPLHHLEAFVLLVLNRALFSARHRKHSVNYLLAI